MLLLPFECHVAQVVLEFSIETKVIPVLLTLPPECWDYSYVASSAAKRYLFMSSSSGDHGTVK